MKDMPGICGIPLRQGHASQRKTFTYVDLWSSLLLRIVHRLRNYTQQKYKRILCTSCIPLVNFVANFTSWPHFTSPRDVTYTDRATFQLMYVHVTRLTWLIYCYQNNQLKLYVWNYDSIYAVKILESYVETRNIRKVVFK